MVMYTVTNAGLGGGNVVVFTFNGMKNPPIQDNIYIRIHSAYDADTTWHGASVPWVIYIYIYIYLPYLISPQPLMIIPLIQQVSQLLIML